MSRQVASPALYFAFQLTVSFVLAQLVLVMPGHPVYARQQSPSGPLTRPCNPDSDALKPKKRVKKRDQSKPLSGTACLEVRENALAAQESLQKFVRDQRWNMGEEQLTEDTWTFSRYLKKEELSDYTKPWTGPAIDWRAGKVQITVRSTELPDGFTRTVVAARFEGYGDLQDQFATKRESWTLQSNGSLESEMTALLQKQSEKSR